MTQAIERDPIYRSRRFQTETIELCVRWYITYRLSYRDLAAMMAERGIIVSHMTIMRWVLQYLPEYERRWNRYARPVNSSWRMDETAIRIRGKSSYLYRAVDKHGKSVDSLLREDRGIEAAQAFFRKATATHEPTWPLTITLDGHAASHRALRLLRDQDSRWKNVLVRSCRYLNNIVEQDHRAIKRRCAPMLGFKSVKTAALTLSGIELAHRVHKRQFHVGCGGHGRHLSLKELWDRALARPQLFDPRMPSKQPTSPATHQNSRPKIQTKRVPNDCEPRRYARKIFDGRGLYMLVMPSGSRYWRYNYRFEGKLKTIALGIYPDVALDQARLRHQVARSLLAEGIDPSARKRAVGIHLFAACRAQESGIRQLARR